MVDVKHRILGKGLYQLQIFYDSFQGTPSQLIYYERPDESGPKLSDYHVTLTEHPEDLKVGIGLREG